MGLKQNTTLLAQLPFRLIGGDPGTLRSMWGRTDLRNQSVGEGIPSELAGIPYGHLAPSSWVLPYQGGAMSAFTYVGASFDVSPLNVAAGVNLTGPTTLTFTVGPSQLDLVVSASALQAVGATSVTFTVGPSTLGAIIDAVASALVTFTVTATPRATGNLEGAVTPFTELSPQSLSAAVWSALANQYNEPGTMGELLNSAGSAADPLLGIVEGTLTLRDVMRLLLAVNAGDATGLEGNTMVFRSQDGTTIRVEASYTDGDRTITTVDPT
jgi:hypothetical protein